VISSLDSAVWPLVARAQQGNRLRRIGVPMPFDENDPEQKRRLSAFTQAIAGLGWTDGRNVRMDVRWGGDDINRMRALAQELVGEPGDCQCPYIRNSYKIYSLLVPGILESRTSQETASVLGNSYRIYSLKYIREQLQFEGFPASM
jgi:hypothetical protein